VLVWSRADGLGDLMLPRYLACGGDPDRVFCAGMGEGGDEDEWETGQGFVAERDGLAVAAGGAGLEALLSNLRALAQLAEEVGCTVLGVVDCRRVGGRDVAGGLVHAIGRGAHARMLLHAARRGEANGAGVLTRVRSRFGPDGDGFEYRLEWAEPAGGVAATRVVWGAPLAGTTQCIIEEAREDPMVAPFSESSAWVREQAMDFLESLLAEGPVPVSRLRQDVNGAGHSWATVRRAKRALGIRADKCSISGTWSWSLGPRRGANSPAADQLAQPS
jgi:putative DNA primase/helicase